MIAQNPFNFFSIDPTLDIKGVVRVCNELSAAANPDVKRLINQAEQEFFKPKRRLELAVFAYHGVSTGKAVWPAFLDRCRKNPIFMRDVISAASGGGTATPDTVALKPVMSGVAAQIAFTADDIAEIAASFDADAATVEYLKGQFPI